MKMAFTYTQPMEDGKQGVAQRLKEIKQSFRLMMDGSAAQSMRSKGLDYRLNWGVPVTALRAKAAEIGKDYDLAIALWKEDVRECKILATLVMPAERMIPDVVDVWMEQTQTLEMAEQAAFNLYQHLPFAAAKAYEWIASEREVCQVSGFHVLSRLFMRGQSPDIRGINEFVDQALAAITDGSLAVCKAAMASMVRFAELGEEQRCIAERALRTAGVELP